MQKLTPKATIEKIRELLSASVNVQIRVADILPLIKLAAEHPDASIRALKKLESFPPSMVTTVQRVTLEKLIGDHESIDSEHVDAIVEKLEQEHRGDAADAATAADESKAKAKAEAEQARKAADEKERQKQKLAEEAQRKAKEKADREARKKAEAKKKREAKEKADREAAEQAEREEAEQAELEQRAKDEAEADEAEAETEKPDPKGKRKL